MVTLLAPQCVRCKHWPRVTSVKGLPCDAFPDGVPDVILRGEHDHREPYPGDNGIRFEPIEEADKGQTADSR